ncbi:hypothetical protein [Autumnicola musiva]|uniref:Uncharacterized protein n=1 Tax=Autumnicola musiva TaxID=3075589 RepID=A0ABU3D463_9FLAO|nr:hypothetical protein [Zunongwangia sp. F117]MDT0676322.1 hypothetical protein [Zunongwangia sp. F117]
MKKIFGFFLLGSLFFSCDSGDIIVTSFDLEDRQLNICGLQTKVLYTTNNEDVYESMSLLINNNAIETEEGLLRTEIGQENVILSATNRLVYRIYDNEVPNSYFCSDIPPSEPQVLEEYISSSRGTIVINTYYRDLTNDADADGDGISNLNEGFNIDGGEHLDSDEDGIPDYLDIDDDNDNVLTRQERQNPDGDPTVGEEEYRDTDEDGIPNYLDTDDDGDGAPTRNEVNEENRLTPNLYLNPADVPFYLDRQNPIFLENEEYIENIIPARRIRTYITILNFSLIKQDGSGEEIKFDEYDLGYFDETIEENYSETEEEEDSEEVVEETEEGE